MQPQPPAVASQQPQGQAAELGDDDPAAALQAAVYLHETQSLLSAKGLGAAAIQAGRKRALQRHYSRRGKSAGSDKAGKRPAKAGRAGLQAKLQLTVVGSKRAKTT